MIKSKYNLFAQLPGENAWLIANSLSGNADLLSAKEAENYQTNSFEDSALWQERGYLVNPEEEEEQFNAAYLSFLKERDQDEIQMFYVPTYGCNFACDYCYQNPYNRVSTGQREVLDGFFSYVDQKFASRKKYLTLFGGEPLLEGATHKREIGRFLELATQRGLETAVVTNGYHVTSYLDVLKRASIREVQVTLDGLEEVHNRRRPLKGGAGTFAPIVQGIDQLLEAHIPVNLRLVLDRDNIDQLPLLAAFAIDRGWTGHSGFKTQLGRNYELHQCYHTPKVLFDRFEMAQQVAKHIEENPDILSFYRPAFHISKHLAEEEVLPPPLFDACPGAKTEWAFDYTGGIYSCTATVGKVEERLGTFYPQVTLDEDAVFEWQDRDVLAISECNTCDVRLICGGGCGALAKNQTGRLHGPDCRPVAEIAAIGAKLYHLNRE